MVTSKADTSFGNLECAMVVGMGEAYVCLCQRPDKTTRSDCVS